MKNSIDWCYFCQDAVSSFSVFITDSDFSNERPLESVDGSGERVRSCQRCAHKLSIAEIEHSDSKEKGRLVFEHDDYKNIANALPSLLKLMVCQACGAPIGETIDDRFAHGRRMLRLFPDTVDNVEEKWVWSCPVCAEQGKCPCCNDTYPESDE